MSQNRGLLGNDLSKFARFRAYGSILFIYLFYCYNLMLGIFVRPTMVRSIAEGGFGFTMAQASSIFAVLSFGTIPGTLFFGMLTTKIGKKKTLMVISIIYPVMTLIPLIAPNSFALWRAARFVAGFALGGVFGTSVPLVSEMFEGRVRGRLIAIMVSAFSIAMIFAGMLYSALGDENWRLLILSAVIPPLLGTVLLYLWVPDDSNQVEDKESDHGETVSYVSMYKGKYLFLGIGAILLSGMNFIAYFGFSNNATTYLQLTLGLAGEQAGAIYSMQGIGQLIGYNFWGWISDKYGRKIPLIGMAASALLVFIYTRLSGESMVTFKIVSLLLGVCVGYSGAWGAYYTELFPKRFSGLAPGISFNGGRLVSALALPFITALAEKNNGIIDIFKASIVVFIIGSFIWSLLPETLHKEEEALN